MAKHLIGVVGGSGYTGAELLRLLAGHPEMEVGPVSAGSNAGKTVESLYPNLIPYAGRTFAAFDASAFAGCALVFAGLPHGESMAVVPSLLALGAKVVDLSGDFRLADAESYRTWYGKQHVAPELLGKGVYGLTELYRGKVSEATLVANPGCYPTATLLGLVPLVRSGLIDPGSIVVQAASGTSGAGRAPAPGLHFAHVDGNYSAYGITGHKHVSEMEAELSGAAGAEVRISFIPHLVPMARGILATSTAQMMPGVGESALREALMQAYESEPFVHVLPVGALPQTKATNGSNACHVTVRSDSRTGRAIVLAALDNLGKGAAGQAIQNANLMLGIPETAGLTAAGLYP
ncbi:MAG: N-acetyl-gamma-glutamyl-phosphate reductase [Actinomycetota bacterium]